MTFRILAIDGGGVRGIFPAHLLASLATRHPDLSTQFDLMVGTSTGAIVAAALATGVDLNRVCSLYEQQAPRIFSKRFGTFWGLTRSLYDSGPLTHLLNEVFADSTFADVPGRLLIPATDVSNGNVFVLKSSYLPTFVRDGDIRLADGILASCAAPGYFDPVQVKEYLLADGGLWGNNPSLIAYTEAVGKLGIVSQDIRILSIGTGTGHQYYDVGTHRSYSWGLGRGWRGVKLIGTAMNVQARSASHMAKLLLKSRYLRISFDETGQLSLSDPNEIPRIKAKAAEAFASHAQELDHFIYS